MKNLYIVRHAKSSWDYPYLSDVNRPLNKRGKKDVPRMAQFVKDKIPCPQVFITSPALRAYKTAVGFAEEFFVPANEVIITKQLYHASAATWLKVILDIQEHYKSAVLFGHNPGITEVANRLTNSHIYNVPTCGIAGIELEITSWGHVTNGGGKLKFFYFPKGIDS